MDGVCWSCCFTLKLVFHKLFLMFAVRVSPSAACFTSAQPSFELNPFYLRRAWGMTAKVWALWIAGSLAWPMRFVAGNKAPRASGNLEA